MFPDLLLAARCFLELYLRGPFKVWVEATFITRALAVVCNTKNLALSVEQVTLDFRVVGSSPLLGVEIT